jgi:hypothetical protein
MTQLGRIEMIEVTGTHIRLQDLAKRLDEVRRYL